MLWVHWQRQSRTMVVVSSWSRIAQNSHLPFVLRSGLSLMAISPSMVSQTPRKSKSSLNGSDKKRPQMPLETPSRSRDPRRYFPPGQAQHDELHEPFRSSLWRSLSLGTNCIEAMPGKVCSCCHPCISKAASVVSLVLRMCNLFTIALKTLRRCKPKIDSLSSPFFIWLLLESW